MTGIPRADGLRLIRIVIVCIALGTVINSAGAVGLYLQGQARSGQTTEALCALRSDLQARVEGSRRFLRDHPDGFLGVSAKEIRDAAANQQRTIAALSGIDCPE